ncbi:TetR/AcrR family transcriptional regulator [Granulicella cerasi]|uniref:TetR/AcrR family transcriptional regulator n=1 Tax=Granulicella cerasi TaxID=741063 RepID=UPI0021E079A9|nr:TetR/AcrR family transcriptional regulator [Granulicella cerasi]
MRKKVPAKKTPEAPQQDRAVQTRKDLMDAARRIFARDGFEVARLQDIAAEAGKTRGALYTHFADKEDLFFALFEEYIAQDSDIYFRTIDIGASFEDRIAQIIVQFERILRDRNRMLLFIEFKMYAVRHPHATKRLADLHAGMCVRGATHKLRVFPEFLLRDMKQQRRAFAIFAATLDGLALQHYFDPLGLPKVELHRKLEEVIREQVKLVAEYNAMV